MICLIRVGLMIEAAPKPWQLSLRHRGSVRSFRIAAAPLEHPEPAIERVATLLRRLGHRRVMLQIGLPSQACLAVRLPAEAMPARTAREALAYRLEEQLPVTAEGIAVDRFPAAADGSALGVCCSAEQVTALRAACAKHRLRISAIAPSAMLAAAKAPRRARHIHLRDDDHDDRICGPRHSPQLWQWLPSNSPAEAEAEVRIRSEAAAEMACSRSTIPFDLRTACGKTNRRIEWMPAAALLMLGLWVGGEAYIARCRSAAEADRAAAAAAFTDALPHETAPPAPQAMLDRLRSAATDTPALSAQSVGPGFAGVLRGLGSLDNFPRIQRLELQRSGGRLAGRTDDLPAVDHLSQSLEAAGLDTEAPRSRRETGGGMHFDLFFHTTTRTGRP